MSDKVGKGVKGPVPLHKSLAAGESAKEAQSAALGRGDGAPKQVPARNVK